MAIRFIIYRKDEHGQIEPIAEQAFDDNVERIQFGRRSKDNDVVLKDSINEVSGQHAAIEQVNNAYFLHDLNSTNGTIVGQERVRPGVPIPLRTGSRVAMANFVIDDLVVVPSAKFPTAQAETGQLLADKPDIRSKKSDARVENDPKALSAGTIPRSTNAMETSAFQALQSLGQELVEEMVVLESKKDIERFCQNIRTAITALVSSLSDLDKGRERILEDFIDIWDKRNHASPLFKQSTQKAINVLLDWRRSNQESESGNALLEKALKLLIVHELALLKSYQEATYRGSLNLLAKLDPKTLAFQMRKQIFSRGPFKIPGKFLGPLIPWLAWKEYNRRHNQLRNEDPQTFEALFRPPFADKYEEIVGRANQAGENLHQTQAFFREHIQKGLYEDQSE